METGVRKNTLKLCFDSAAKQPSYLEVLRFITGTLKLGSGDLHSAYKDENDGYFYIKFLDEAKFNGFTNQRCEAYAFPYDDGTRTPVTLTVASRIFRYVRIFNLPPEIDDRAIAQVMGQFGSIRQHVRERYPAECNLNIFNGVRGVHMEIAKEIPASLFIGHFRARIYYDGLKNRCFYCKEEGHLKAACPKLAAAPGGSGVGGKKSYSNVVAPVRPVPAPIVNVPAMEPEMQVLKSSKNDAAEVHQVVVNEIQPSSSKTAEELIADMFNSKSSEMDVSESGKQAAKRVAESSASETEDGEKFEGSNDEQQDSEGGGFQKPKTKRNKNSGNNQKPVETINTRSQQKKR